MASSSASVSCLLKLFYGALAVVVFLCVLLVGTVDSQVGTATATSPAPESFARDMKHAGMVGRENKLVHPELDLNYMSKRRVPNGPDPIHNRRAGNSGRPPGRA